MRELILHNKTIKRFHRGFDRRKGGSIIWEKKRETPEVRQFDTLFGWMSAVNGGRWGAGSRGGSYDFAMVC